MANKLFRATDFDTELIVQDPGESPAIPTLIFIPTPEFNRVYGMSRVGTDNVKMMVDMYVES